MLYYYSLNYLHVRMLLAKDAISSEQILDLMYEKDQGINVMCLTSATILLAFLFQAWQAAMHRYNYM